MNNIYQFLLANIGQLGTTFLIVIGAIVLTTVSRKVFRTALFRIRSKMPDERYARTNTIRLLLVNIISTVVFVIALLTVLTIWGVNITPLLAGVGIFGLALSFGSQSLVKDFIGGFFIILEDQFRVGDVIKVGTYEGTVKKITIRSTIIKDAEGNRIFIPNSKIDIVTKVHQRLKKKVKVEKISKLN